MAASPSESRELRHLWRGSAGGIPRFGTSVSFYMASGPILYEVARLEDMTTSIRQKLFFRDGLVEAVPDASPSQCFCGYDCFYQSALCLPRSGSYVGSKGEMPHQLEGMSSERQTSEPQNILHLRPSTVLVSIYLHQAARISKAQGYAQAMQPTRVLEVA